MRYLFSLLTITSFSLSAKFAQAANLRDAFNQQNFLGRVAGPDGAGYNLNNRSIDPIIGQLILLFTSLLGVIFVLLMIYGGYNWMTAADNEKKVKTAQETIKTAIIGLIVVLAAYMITYFVMVRIAAPAINI